MQLSPINGSLINGSGFSRLLGLRALSWRDVRPSSTSAGPWICRRCHTRLKRTTFPTSPAKRSSSKLRSSQVIARISFSTTSRPNDSPSNPESNAPRPSPPPPSSSLPSHTESLRSPLSHRFTHLMDTVQSTLANQTQHLNTLTGYTPIESLKASISAHEIRLQDTRSALAAARTAYSQSIKQRSASQREVNELLQRKHNWSPSDLERFTELYRSDHANELNESQAHEALVRAEKEAEEAGQQLSESILKRYHEEQIWSDKIRRMSTWGTWGLMGVNVLLFFIFQVGVEPWRRARLVKGFEEKVMEALEREVKLNVNLDASKAGDVQAVNLDVQANPPDEATAQIREGVDSSPDAAQSANVDLEKVIEEEIEKQVVETVRVERSIDQVMEEEVVKERGRTVVLTDKVKGLFSERQVVVRQWDLTALALEGAAAGMTVAGLLVLLLRPR
ncbi:MAG: hypothetical protein Q9184_004520 [Pyrenodesmia sp. 2 TL-2023]